jgi:hypothetical protein
MDPELRLQRKLEPAATRRSITQCYGTYHRYLQCTSLCAKDLVATNYVLDSAICSKRIRAHIDATLPSSQQLCCCGTLTAASPTFSAGWDCQNGQPHLSALNLHRKLTAAYHNSTTRHCKSAGISIRVTPSRHLKRLARDFHLQACKISTSAFRWLLEVLHRSHFVV